MLNGGGMLNGFARYALTASSVAPVCLTIGFLAFITDHDLMFYISLGIAIFSVLLCFFIIKATLKISKVTTKNLISASPADREITNYFLTYLFPLIAGKDTFMDWKISAFFYISLFFYIKHSSSYSFNPIVSVLFGYKFYEAEDDTGISFVLMAKRPLLDAKISGMKVIKLTEHTYIYQN